MKSVVVVRCQRCCLLEYQGTGAHNLLRMMRSEIQIGEEDIALRHTTNGGDCARVG
jgi:hypothetical protein